MTFEATKEPNQPTKSVMKLGSVVTEESLLNRSVKLETSLQNGNLTEFCDDKLSSDDSSGEKKVWQYIKVHMLLKVVFFSESEIRFSNFPVSPKNYSKKLS